MHNKQQNSPNVTFLVRVETPAKEHLLWYTVDQVLMNHRDAAAWERLKERIKSDLRAHTARTGLTYLLFHYGLTEHVKAFMKEHGIEVE